MEWSPQVQLSYLQTKRGEIAVVRDDLLLGGTKQRAAIPFLRDMKAGGVHKFVYASPFSGYAQIALAVSCKATQVECAIFAESCNGGMSDFTSIAAKYATIQLADSLEEAEQKAIRHCSYCDERIVKVPLGFNHPLYKLYLRRELEVQWKFICQTLGTPKNLWLPIGSGTLAETFKSVITSETNLNCIDVRVLPETDKRLVSLIGHSNLKYRRTPELFCDPVINLPPIPSNKFYDAKLWQFIFQEADPGDLWWNVAA